MTKNNEGPQPSRPAMEPRGAQVADAVRDALHIAEGEKPGGPERVATTLEGAASGAARLAQCYGRPGHTEALAAKWQELAAALKDIADEISKPCGVEGERLIRAVQAVRRRAFDLSAVSPTIEEPEEQEPQTQPRPVRQATRNGGKT